MDRALIQSLADKFCDEAEGNVIKEGQDRSEGYVGYRLFERPIFAIGNADDPLFEELRKPEAVGPSFQLPEFWLPGAKTVISFFSPLTAEVKESNAQHPTIISTPWLYGRVEGEEYLDSLANYLIAELNKAGYGAVVPLIDPRYLRLAPPLDAPRSPPNVNPYSVNWAERHVAYICGLGTFGLASNLITRTGTAGRLFSIVTDWDAQTDVRPYSSIYEYCTKCGVCIKKCPADAINKEFKDVSCCSSYIRENREPYLPRFGCGKCQVSIPCQDGIPGQKQKT